MNKFNSYAKDLVFAYPMLSLIHLSILIVIKFISVLRFVLPFYVLSNYFVGENISTEGVKLGVGLVIVLFFIDGVLVILSSRVSEFMFGKIETDIRGFGQRKSIYNFYAAITSSIFICLVLSYFNPLYVAALWVAVYAYLNIIHKISDSEKLNYAWMSMTNIMSMLAAIYVATEGYSGIVIALVFFAGRYMFGFSLASMQAYHSVIRTEAYRSYNK